MSVLDAAEVVLRESGKPLHVKDITKRILSRKLWKTSGKTPEATVGARLYSDIKTNGDSSSFVLHEPKLFGLREWKSDPVVVIEPPSIKNYSFIESAREVLEKFGRKQPMHYREITEKAIEEGWLIADKNKTPESSMYSQLIREIRRSELRGEQSRFVKHGGGLVSLSKWMGSGLVFEIEKHNKKVRKELQKRLLDMEWDAFEKLVARFLAEMGFEIEVTDRIDGGVDVRGTLVVADVIRIQLAVQVKKWKRNVQAPTVNQLRGSLGVHEQGLIITTGGFSTGAKEAAVRQNAVPVALMDGEQLVALLVDNEIGIKRRRHDLIELDEEDTLFT